MKKNYLICVVMALTILAGCACEKKDNTLTSQEKKEGWKLLFDGETTNGWRGFNSAEIPQAWSATDGTLMSAGEGGDIGGDIITTEKYDNFHLKLDWKLSPEGNSGIMYHVVEAPELKSTYYSGPEYQIIDDIGFPGGVTPYNSTGANYAMTPADTTQKVLYPVGEWNSSEIIFDNGKVSHYLNGKKIVEFTAWTEEWKANVANGKWSKYPAYGKAKTGHIALQDHGSYIWFKNIKIKAL
ncbi:3-keto-disaccharide hydrolase [Saccharicrinis sp. GN24d3]|uniref:3-keto-disaccharide hydrolase n=1 Tax=Saccharicrinis sp. GN24d3 TaxID=3458416 RepID=UPI004035ED62